LRADPLDVGLRQRSRAEASAQSALGAPHEASDYLCNDDACSMPVSEPARIAQATDVFMAEQRAQEPAR
jgi:hypothetical protein